MGYKTDWIAITDDAFKGRCWAALLDLAEHIVAGDTGFPPADNISADGIDHDKKIARFIQRGEQNLTQEQNVKQVLRNATIRGGLTVDVGDVLNDASVSDADILWTLNNTCWPEIRSIG
jgi:hypothetical protein